MKNIIVVATLTLKEADSKSVLESLKALHQATHQNDIGFLQYDLLKDTEKANTYTFIETWESEEILNRHMNQAHFKAFEAALAGKIESMTIQKLEKIL